MTNISVFGEDKERQSKKPIEFVYWIDERGNKSPVEAAPCWINITLLNRGYYDLFFAWDDDPQNDGCAYLGHWNDGIVE